MKSKILFLLFLLIQPMLLSAQQGSISFEASTDARQVVLGGVFEVAFTLKNANGDQFTPPSFRDFNVISGPSSSISTTSVNGQWSREMSYSYTLQPKKIGTFTIGRATINANGKQLASKPLKVQVVKGKKSNAATQKDLEDQLEQQIFIKAIPSDFDGYIGQQIILDYKLYTTREVESYNLLSESDYHGFYAQEVRRYDSRVFREVIDGVQYSTKILKRVALFPQQAGLLTIEPMNMQLAIISGEQPRRRSFFFTPSLTRLNIRTNEAALNIRALPSNPPTSFTGAVGKFRMSTTVNRSELTTDDAVSIRMTITGNGDIKQVQAPTLTIDNSFELYDPKVSQENSFRENNGIFFGEKIFEYLALPKTPGRYVVQPEFSYFDTDSLSYVTLKAQTFPLIVKPGTVGKTNNETTVDNLKPQQDIRHIYLSTKLRKKEEEFAGSTLFWFLLILPFLTFGSVYITKYLQEKRLNISALDLKRKRANAVAQKRLATAKSHLNNQSSRPFYDEISRALFGYICDKLNIPFSELTKENVKGKLESLQVSPTAINDFMKVVQTAEMALFAGMDNASAMQETYQKAINVVADIEEEIGK